jgi:hypothetical protein
MAISNKEKLAYVLKYAPKSDEKIQKIIRLAATMDSPKSKLTPEQKEKVKEGLNKLYARFEEINEQKKGAAKSPTQKEPYFKAALKDFQNKVGKIEYKRATTKTDIKKDIERPALKAGKRYPKEGTTSNQYGTFKNNPKAPYWENRANRMDVNQPSRTKYPKLAKGGGVDMLKEDDYVWNTLGKKIIVDKVTKDEYFLIGFGQSSASPFSKSKVHSYLKSGQWSLKPKKLAKGGLSKHGLKIGDEIERDLAAEKSVVVRNKKTDKTAVVNLDKGIRKESKVKGQDMKKYAKGGEVRITAGEKKKSLKGNPTFNF